jgi:hypothetical protein
MCACVFVRVYVCERVLRMKKPTGIVRARDIDGFEFLVACTDIFCIYSCTYAPIGFYNYHVPLKD